MVRLSKKAKRKAVCKKKRRPSFADKTGPKKDNLEKGYREHANAIESTNVFIPKVK